VVATSQETVEDRSVDISIPWDAFIRSGAERTASAEQRESWVAGATAHIAGFRKVEWPNIVHALRASHKIVIPDGLEPHWTEAGRAVFWQEQTVRRGVTRSDKSGTWRELEEVTLGWKPTNPLPANNAGQIAHYLGKGMRLRPPENGVDVEILNDVSAPPSESQPVQDPVVYICGRHLERGRMAFATWKAYVQHTVRYGEVPDQEPPPDVLQRRATSAFYCDVHDVTFKTERHAGMHIKVVHQRQKQFREVTLAMLRTGEANE
jgi:hypothetical protein